MNWRIKGTVQKALSCMPLGVQVNHVLQRTAGGLRRFQSAFDNKISDALLMLSYMRECGVSPAAQEMMEIGTGWFPVLPICFSIAGAARCRTYDLHRHLNPSLTLKMLQSFPPYLQQMADALGSGALGRDALVRDVGELQTAHARLLGSASSEELFQRARIEYRAPADATKTGIDAGTLDIVYSNSVLEHVTRPAIAAMMKEAARILKPGGLLIHAINCGDHYAYFDRNCSAINYLTYTEAQWTFWNNDLLYQNRMRPRDFLDLSDDAGLAVILKRDKPREDLIAALPGMKIAPQFKDYPPQDLCCTSFDFVARKPT